MADDSNATTTRQAPARTRNRRGEGARLRDDIVAAAVGLLDETGDEKAVTLRSVARRVGIAAPSIYRHFSDQPSIMLAVVAQELGELEARLRAEGEAAGDDPRARLFAVCHAYLDYAREHPGRYRTMFGGVWMPDVEEGPLSPAQVSALGEGTLTALGEVVGGCVDAGLAQSDDVAADAVALWLGLHGLAHQRAATVAFPWPPGIADRMITALARLKSGPKGG